MNFSDDCPDDGAPLGNAKPLRAALLWHRSRWLNLIPCNTLWCQGSLGVFAIIWIYSLICHLSWDFSLSSYIYHCILQFSNQSFLEIVCNHHLELKTLQLFLFFYRHGICSVQRDALRACSAGSFGGDGGVWANITQRQDSCAQKIWRGAKKTTKLDLKTSKVTLPTKVFACRQCAKSLRRRWTAGWLSELSASGLSDFVIQWVVII